MNLLNIRVAAARFALIAAVAIAATSVAPREGFAGAGTRCIDDGCRGGGNYSSGSSYRTPHIYMPSHLVGAGNACYFYCDTQYGIGSAQHNYCSSRC